MYDPLGHLLELLDHAGARRYGSEAVSQREHALQCATLALEEHAAEPLVVACLLHDLGHLLHDPGEADAGRAGDDRHEFRAQRLLRRLYGEEVTVPIRLHVAAKRYLCAVRPGYYDRLSPTSRTSLAAQGGPYTWSEAEDFLARPHADAAIQLRLWDDRAKTPGAATPGLEYFVDVLERCRR